MALRILKADEKAAITTAVTQELCVMNHTSVHPKIAAPETETRVALTWTFDYTDVSRAELIEMASKHLVIVQRTTFKAIDAPKDEWDTKTFKVRDYLDHDRRKPKDSVKSTVSMLKGMTPEQVKAALLAAGIVIPEEKTEESQPE